MCKMLFLQSNINELKKPIKKKIVLYTYNSASIHIWALAISQYSKKASNTNATYL